ncbi:Insulin-like growth factor-binding protein 1, partial [Calypte anna]
LLRRCWLPSLLLPALLGPRIAAGAALHPLRCAPCTPEQLTLCPTVAPGCPEMSRQPGCGCCHAIAIDLSWYLISIIDITYSSCLLLFFLYFFLNWRHKCKSLLKMFTIIFFLDSIEPEGMPLESTEITQDQLLNYQLMFLIGQDKPIPWNAITAYENMKAKRISELKKWKEQGPCQKELYKALYKLAKAQQRSGGEIYKFYLPNCNKNGFYQSKQCTTSLDGESAGCWCVYPKTGKKIPGSPEMNRDLECQQYLNSQE